MRSAAALSSSTSSPPPRPSYPPSTSTASSATSPTASEPPLPPTGVQFVLQPEQRGTGHAMQMLKADFELSGAPLPKHLLVLSGDVPLIRPETIAAVRDVHLSERAAMTILTAAPADPTGYGRVLRLTPEGAEVTAIVEQNPSPPTSLMPRDQLRNLLFRDQGPLRKLDALDTNNPHGEFYLTDIAAMLVAEGKRVVAIKADSVDEVLGANTIAEMMHLDAAIRLATAKRLMVAGVTIFRPETCVIDAEVSVGPDTVIEPYVQLLGATRIGSESRIRSYSVIQNSTLGDNVLVRNGCILDTAEVADNAVLGPYAHLRPESRIGEGAHIGNFVETKKATLGKGAKANHLNYLATPSSAQAPTSAQARSPATTTASENTSPPSATAPSSAPTPPWSPR